MLHHQKTTCNNSICHDWQQSTSDKKPSATHQDHLTNYLKWLHFQNSCCCENRFQLTSQIVQLSIPNISLFFFLRPSFIYYFFCQHTVPYALMSSTDTVLLKLTVWQWYFPLQCNTADYNLIHYTIHTLLGCPKHVAQHSPRPKRYYII
jgi:hypothetical protein